MALRTSCSSYGATWSSVLGAHLSSCPPSYFWATTATGAPTPPRSWTSFALSLRPTLRSAMCSSVGTMTSPLQLSFMPSHLPLLLSPFKLRGMNLSIVSREKDGGLVLATRRCTSRAAVGRASCRRSTIPRRAQSIRVPPMMLPPLSLLMACPMEIQV